MSSNPTDRDDRRDVAGPHGAYADVNGLHLYHEVHGDGSPLVLLHGGMLNIDAQMRELIEVLSPRHRVVAVEQQGHGRTADIDREITPAALATDVVALFDHLGIDRAHVLGHSMGAAVALELAVRHPDRVRSVVPVSASVRREGMHADLGDPGRMATSTRMPTAEDFRQMQQTYARLSPHPERFDAFLAKLSASNADLRGWSDEELSGVSAPVLFVMGDHDFTTVEHAQLMLELTPGSRLAVLPGTTHMDVMRRTALLDLLLAEFLD